MRVQGVSLLAGVAATLQQPAAGGDSVNEVLLYMGIGIIAILAFGFILLRRARQRPVASAFDDGNDGDREGRDEIEGVEHIL